MNILKNAAKKIKGNYDEKRASAMKQTINTESKKDDFVRHAIAHIKVKTEKR